MYASLLICFSLIDPLPYLNAEGRTDRAGMKVTCQLTFIRHSKEISFRDPEICFETRANGMVFITGTMSQGDWFSGNTLG